jgi:hypothetical protein
MVIVCKTWWNMTETRFAHTVNLYYLSSGFRKQSLFPWKTLKIGFVMNMGFLCCWDVWNILTYLLTPWSRVLLEKLTINFAASQEIPRIYGIRNFLTVPTSARHLSLSWVSRSRMKYRVSHELRSLLRESVSYVKIYRYNPKHLCPKLNVYGEIGQRKVGASCGSTYCIC